MKYENKDEKIIDVVVKNNYVFTSTSHSINFINNVYNVFRQIDDESYTRYLQLKSATDELYSEKERIETKVDDNYSSLENTLILHSSQFGSEAYMSSVLESKFNSEHDKSKNYTDAGHSLFIFSLRKTT